MSLLSVETPLENTTNVLVRLNLIYAGYRIVLPLFLIALFLATANNPFIGQNDPILFLQTNILYTIVTIIGFFAIKYIKKQQLVQNVIMLIIDVFMLSCLLYSNGGPSLQLSMLYLVVVMAASILLPGSRAMAIAMLAVITVVYQQFYYALYDQASIKNIGGALLLSISFIAISSLGQFASRRLKQVESLAQSSSKKVTQLQDLNQKIIEEIQSGILVLDPQHHIIFINQAAKSLLNSYHATAGEHLRKTSDRLSALIQTEIQAGRVESFLEPNIDPRFKQGLRLSCIPILLSSSDEFNILVMLENLYNINQQAQQLKLASLGRLTAGIAHEIRNPLAAITQASELLAEQITTTSDTDLLQMIKKQSGRINRIIEDILKLSRESRAKPTKINLQQWCTHTLQDVMPEAKNMIHIDIKPTLTVSFDPTQLEQVLINLISNAIHHSKKKSDVIRIDIVGGVLPGNFIHLDVIDHGPGIKKEHEHTLFEPFFTTESNGTGLGLYLSRVFCEANSASLSYIASPIGACFRITFSRRLHARHTGTQPSIEGSSQ